MYFVKKEDVPLVEFMYLVFTCMLRVCVWEGGGGDEDVPLVEFMYACQVRVTVGD